MKKHILNSRFFIAPAVLLLALMAISPILSGVYNSFFHDYYGRRSFAGLDNYLRFFKDHNFGYSLRITLVWALLNTVISLAGGYVLAALLVRTGKPSTLLYAILLIPWGIPVYIAVPLWRAFLHGNGGNSLLTLLFTLKINLLTDPVAAFLATLAVSTWLMLPLTTFVFFGVMRKVPIGIIEAARIDGADAWDLNLNIYLPQLQSMLLLMGVLNFIKALKEFTVIFLLTAGGPPLRNGITATGITGATGTLEIMLYELFTESGDAGIPAAYSVIMIALVLFFLFFWLAAKREKHSDHSVIVMTAMAQLLFASSLGLLWTLSYLAGLKWRKMFIITLTVSAAVNLLQCLAGGFLIHFNSGLIVAAVAGLLLYFRNRQLSGSGIAILPRPSKLGLSLVVAAGTLLLCLCTAVLMYLLVWMSLSKLSACYIDSLLPRFMSVINYIKVFVDENVLHYFFNTALLALCTAGIIPLISLPAAYSLTRCGGRFANSFMLVIKAAGIMTGIHSLIPLYTLFNTMGLIDSYVPLVLIYLFQSLAFSVFIMKTYLDKFPAGFSEIALLEGMRPFAYLVKIIFPVSAPVITTAAMVAFLNAWNGFLAPLLFLNDDAKYPIGIKLYTFAGSIASGNPRWNLFAAASCINLVFIFLIFLLLKKAVGYSPVMHYEDQD